MQLTISWQPGALRGMTEAQTSNLIVGACQMWQKVCGVRFGILPFGRPTTVTVYPWSRPMNGWMVAYPATRQILYSTLQTMDPRWARMAFAHEIAHCFGWGHSATSKVEDIMHPKGSSVFYFAAHEAQRTRRQFGNPSHRHRPESIDYVKSEIARLQRIRPQTDATRKQIADRQAQLARLQREWRAIGDPQFVSAKKPNTGVCQCFGDSQATELQDWVSVFERLRAAELNHNG